MCLFLLMLSCYNSFGYEDRWRINMRNYLYGVDVGGTTIKIGLFASDMKHLGKVELKTPSANHDTAIFDTILEGIKQLNTDNQLTFDDIVGIGVAVPCPIKEGYAEKCANLDWYQINLTESFKKRVPKEVKVRFANDANIAALGERSMLTEMFDDVVMVTLGTGVGGGVILGGKMIEGARGAGGEIGHMMVIDPKALDFDCGCGARGCLEQIAGTKGILLHAKQMIEQHPDSMLSGKTLTVKAVFDAAKAGDVAAMKTFDRITDYLARALSTVAVIIEPEVFIIGGGVSKAGQFLLDAIQTKYKKYARFDTGKIKFALAVSGNDAGMIGSALMIKQS